HACELRQLFQLVHGTQLGNDPAEQLSELGAEIWRWDVRLQLQQCQALAAVNQTVELSTQHVQTQGAAGQRVPQAQRALDEAEARAVEQLTHAVTQNLP